jgi:predicted Zn-dependent protease
MKERFFQWVDRAVAHLHGSEVLLASFCGERSDFVRFNRARVRQAGTVSQANLTLSLIDRGRRSNATVTMQFDTQRDSASIDQTIRTLRADLEWLPPDPYLQYATEIRSSDLQRKGRLPEAEQAVDCIVRAAGTSDLVGIYASGPVYRGFANSLGQRNWHEVDSFQFDWSVYLIADKAAKSCYANHDWDSAEIEKRIADSREPLRHLSESPRCIQPGCYRAFLTPAAVEELLTMLSWDGVSGRSQATRQSALQRLVDGEASLAGQVSLRENTADGLAPAFDDAGFTKPETVSLIREGAHAGALVCARTAKEYGLPANGANQDEAMQSAELSGGDLPMSGALAALDRGILVANLWYLNYSDRSSCRITGMTRFATFWVEHGRVQAPINPMRFDDSIYRMLGSDLEALTREREWVQSRNTYGQRSVETSRVPGALLSSLTLTL